MQEVQFTISLLFFWVKGSILVDSRFVKVNLANTILGFIPAGRDQQNIPLKNISGSMLSTKYFIKPFILGLIIFFIGLGTIGDSFLLGLIIVLIGLGIAANGIQTILVIEKAGSPYQISVPFFEKKKMELLNEQIHNALSDDTDKTDLNQFFDKKVQD
ncbi:hypothetical protein KQI76_03270 [Amphibacillus sp. MSJ-3]|uniref:hypothetical protein n=1 Tax=Amphibacillus sp. MSJ-3 TaxID=2841505 RepID=UPI001C0F383B|nr:hypothetical protein [Amphibacillus sp. MSJ-3]MBU5594175.1 hypothetical protein [Amphibacillus sp. MSJ-3]